MKLPGKSFSSAARINDLGVRSTYGSAEKRKPRVLSVLLIVLGAVLGIFRAYAVTPLSGLPDVLLIYVLALACFYDGSTACLTALIAGSLCDVLGSETVRLCTLFCTAAAFMPDLVSRDNPKSRARWFYVLLAVFAFLEIVVCGIGKLFGGTFTVQVLFCALRTVLYGAVVGSLLVLFTAAVKKIK